MSSERRDEPALSLPKGPLYLLAAYILHASAQVLRFAQG